MADDEEEKEEGKEGEEQKGGDEAPKKKQKKGKDGKQDDEEEVDYRLEFILDYLTKAMKIKQEKWSKMIILEDCKVSYSSIYYILTFWIALKL